MKRKAKIITVIVMLTLLMAVFVFVISAASYSANFYIDGQKLVSGGTIYINDPDSSAKLRYSCGGSGYVDVDVYKGNSETTNDSGLDFIVNCSSTADRLSNLDTGQYVEVKTLSSLAEGTYTVRVSFWDNKNWFGSSQQGSTRYYHFIVDRTAPVGELWANGIKFQHGGITSSTVTFTYTDGSATLDGVAYTTGTPIYGVANESHRYIIILTDVSGNTTTYWFYIDRLAPIGTLSSGVTNGGATNGSVSLTWSEANVDAKISGGEYSNSSYTKGTVLYGAENSVITYTITLSDIYNNSNNYTFTIDRLAPTGTLTGVEPGGTTGGSVSFAWSEDNCTATLDGKSYSKSNLISGTYNTKTHHTIILSDYVGNTTTYSFTINRVNPIISLYDEINDLNVDGFYTNKKVYFRWSNTTDAGACTVKYKKDDGVWIYGYLQSYYYNSEIPDVKYADEDTAKAAILNTEKEKIVGLSAWDGTGEVYSSDLSIAILGNPCWSYRDKIFFSETTLNSVISSNTNTLCQHSNKNYISEEGVYTVQITGYYGVTVTKTFTIDKTAPTGTLTTTQDGGFAAVQNNCYYTNGSVTFTYTDGSATLNGASYISGTAIEGVDNENKEYVIKLTDLAGNVTQYNVYINKALPSGTLSTTQNGGFRQISEGVYLTNGTVKFTYDEVVYSATLDDAEYNSREEITEEGTYELVLVDTAQNKKTYTIIIDKTAPIGELRANGIELQDGGITGSTVTFTYTDGSATLNSASYISGTAIEGVDGKNTEYETLLTDAAGNTSRVSFVIDRLVPEGTLKADKKVISSGSSTNEDVTFTWSEAGCTATLGGVEYTDGTVTVSAEGFHEILLTDSNGNQAHFSFTIDKTAPEGELVGITDGGVTKEDVSFVWRGEENTVQVNGTEIIGSLQADGSFLYVFFPEEESTLSYYVKIIDDVGNYSEYSFTLDTDAPEGTLNGSFNASNKTKNDVSFSWNEAGCTATLNGNNYEKGTAISVENSYSLILTDLAGNSTEYTFIIDKTAPVGELVGVTDGSVTKGTVKFKWTEAGCTATLNDVAYTKNSEISAESYYTVILTDDVGNSTTYTFRIDLTAPIGELRANGIELQNGGITNGSVSFTWSEAGCTATLNGEPYANGAEISTEASYELKLYDEAQNVTVYTFEIDCTAPVGELVGVTDGGATKGSVSFTWSGDYYTATLNGEPYTSGTAITAEASYELKLYDEAQNVTVYIFEIDRTAPTGTLINVDDGGITKKTVSFSWKVSAVGICTATLNGEEYISGTSIEQEHFHTIVLSDRAGNSTIYTFEIDRTPATVTFSAAYNTLSDVLYFKDNFSISWAEADASATLNGNNYVSGTLITAEASYELVVSDAAGNNATYSLVLDKTAYTQNRDYFASQGKDNPAKWYQTYYYTFGNNNYNLGGYYSFSNYEDALKYATARETEIVEKHDAYTGNTIVCSWANRAVDGYDVLTNSDMLNNTYSIYFDINDRSKLVAYFNESNLNAAIAHYAEQSVEEKYIPSSPAIAFPGGYDVSPQNISRNAIFIKASSFAFKYSPSGVALYVDGNLSSHDVSLGVGYHNIKEVDASGNVCEYTVVIDGTAPAVMSVDASGNILPALNEQFASSSTVYASQVFSIIPNDNFDNIPLIIITFNGNQIYRIGEAYTFTTSGSYVIELYDVAGNKSSFTLYLSLEAPAVTESDVLSSKGTFLGKKILIDKVLSFNKILTLAISKYDTDALIWVALSVDSEGKSITTDTLSYYIAESGLFKIVLTDNFGRTVEKQIEIYKDAPVGKIFSVDGFELSSGTHTQKNIYFTWEDDSCTAYIINGESTLEYTKKSYITAEGIYTIKLVDLSNIASIYTVIIDRTAPTGTILKSEGSGTFTEITNGSYSNKAVKITWNTESEPLTTATFSKNGGDYLPYANGSIISEDGYYIVKLTDGAGNSRSHSFEIDRTVVTVSIIAQNGDVLQNGALTNQSFYFAWSESGCTATLGGQSYTSKTLITTSGIYSFYIEDRFGNYAYYTVTIDKVLPEGELVGATNGGITNGSASFTWSEDDCTATLNGEPYANGAEISTEASYELMLYDKAQNVTVYTFVIDKTAPVGELVGVVNGGVTNGSVYFTWKENGCTATLGGEDYTKKTYLTADNSYSLILTDLAGNSTEYTFVIDTLAPEGELIGAENGGFTNSDVFFVWHEAYCTATLNGEPYASGAEISAEASYELMLYDKAQNVTVYTFVIDKTAPTGSFSTSGYQDGAMYVFNTAVTFTWSESYLTAKLDGDDYKKRDTINTQGVYRLELSDRAGNSTVYIFELDFEKPVGELVGDYVVRNEIYYFKEAFSFVWEETNCTATLDGNEYISGDLITDEAAYVIVLKDSVGNFTEVKAVLDKTAPTAEFSTSYNTVNGVLYFKSTFYANWNGSDVTATLNDVTYAKKSYIAEEKSFTLILSDIAGNSTTYSLVLDTTAPTALFSQNPVNNFGTLYFKNKVQISWLENGISATLNDEPISNNSIAAIEGTYTLKLKDRAGNSTTCSLVLDMTAPVGVLTGVTDGGISNTYVSFKWDESGCTATLNGATYKKGTNIYNPDSYTVVIYDIAGNSTEYSFVIDFEVPVGELVGVENGGITNNDVFFTWDAEGLTATLNGEPYSKGYVISEEKLHTVVLTSEAGNSTTYTFTIDKTAPVGVLTGVTDGGITNTTVLFKWSEAGCTATLNGEAFDKNSYISQENSYLLILTDAAGNSTEYRFIIDKTAPDGTLAGVLNGGITNSNVSLTWSESGCTATLNGEPYANGAEISTEASYELKLYDKAQNFTVYSFIIDKTAPIGELVGVVNGGVTNGSVYLTWSEASCTATISGENYVKKTHLTADNLYCIILTDAAGNSTEYSFTIDAAAPEGYLSGVVNGGITNSNVIFTWTEIGCTATINGTPYTSGTVISEEKTYTITLKDICENTVIYTFTIDKTAPTGTLTGVVNGGITNGKVKLEFPRNYTATLNDFAYTSGKEISEENAYELKLYDEAQNVTVYIFEIDRTAPTGSFSSDSTSVSGIYYYPLNTYFIWSDINCTATLNGVTYVFGTPITEDNSYELILKDTAQNTTVYTFRIDSTAPVGELVGVENGGYTKESVSLSWNESDTSATLNGNNYKKGTSIFEEKRHTVELKDSIGNSSFYTFTIDSTSPTFLVGKDTVTELVLRDGNSLTLTPYDVNLKTFTFNGVEYAESLIINTTDLQDGTYEAVAEDFAGNITKISVIVNKTAPIISFQDEYVSNNNGNFFTKHTSFSWDEDGCTATINGAPYKKNSTIYSDGAYLLELTDRAGNKTTFSFNILTVASSSPLSYTLEDSTVKSVDTESGKTYSSLTPLTVNLVAGSTVYINGEAINENYILSTPGVYTVKTVNAAGVEVEYTATILEPEDEDRGSSTNVADIALKVVGISSGVGVVFTFFKGIIKRKKIKIKRL